jgi:SAM-dependent methyltransferase
MDLKKIEVLYTDNLEKFGIDSKSVGWNSPESQELRFQKLCEVIQDPANTPFSINELGCGYGELFKFFQMRSYKLTEFNGYDISQKMLDAANEYVNDEKAKWIKDSKIRTKADYTITSGIFNVKFEEQKDNWENYIKDTLTNMFEFSNKGISFNLLTKYVDYEADNLYYGDPALFFDFCKRNLSPRVNLFHDYKLYEWTIVVRK